jgi:hypothetical protein
MAHTLQFGASGSIIPIYVDEDSVDILPGIVEHAVLDASHSTLQYVGQKNRTRTIGYHLYGKYASYYLKQQFADGKKFLYTDDTGASGSYVATQTPVFRRLQALNYPDTWYRVEMKASRLIASGSLYYEEP